MGAATKRSLGQTRRLLVWKLVVFPYNVPDMETATRRHEVMGFDALELVLDKDGKVQREAVFRQRTRLITEHRPCYWSCCSGR